MNKIEKSKISSNKFRGKTFGVVINPLLNGESVEWKDLSSKEIKNKLKELNFISKDKLGYCLNNLELENVNKRLTCIEDFEGQFELGSDTKIPHYQLAVKTATLCTKPKLLKSLQDLIEGHISVDIQHNFENMKNYCTKESEYISDDYSGRLFKKQWKETFLNKKPNLKNIIEQPYLWQELFKVQVLSTKPDDRIVDWLIDPIGNTGKSSFARAYCSSDNTDAILMKIDNLDRMELSLINKISKYRDQYFKDPKIIFFDFPRASSMIQVMQATALMEDAKSGYLESNFGGKHKNVKMGNVHVVVLSNTAPDLSVLSVDRWRLWRLGGERFNNIIWPCRIQPKLLKYNRSDKSSTWCIEVSNYTPNEISLLEQFKGIELSTEWYDTHYKTNSGISTFGVSQQTTNGINSLPQETPNYIRLLVIEKLESLNDKNIISFNN